jgi:diguanylate cyclase (GGDEF)-like protein/PAS domain S-box-containing protein
MVMSTDPDTPRADPADGLARALEAHPDAGVAALNGEGRTCPVPESLDALLAGHPVVPGDSPFEMIDPATWDSAINGWMHVTQHGIGGGPVRDLAGNDATLACYDVRPQHGVLVMLLVDGVDDAVLPEVRAELPLTSRFGTFAREVIGRFTAQDEGGHGLLGWSADELESLTDAELIHPDDQANAQAAWLEMLSNPGSPCRWRGRHRHADGSWKWLEVTNTNGIDDPEVGHVVSEMMDVSEEMAATEALRERQEVLDRLHDALPLGVCQIDRERNVTYANDQLYDLIGCTRDDDLSLMLAAAAGDNLPILAAAAEAAISGTDRTCELHLRLTDGAERVCLIDLRPLRDAAGTVTGALVCASDITESTTLRRELEVRATIDLLTGCHNRGATIAALGWAITGHRDQRGLGTGVIFLDLDRFKPINDQYGHAAGDELLVAVVARLRRLVRDGDVVGRIGGDEFLIVCPGLFGSEGAMAIARRMTAELAAPIRVAGTTVTIGASVGVAWSDDLRATPDSLVAAADAAMYRSKRDGRCQAVLAC